MVQLTLENCFKNPVYECLEDGIGVHVIVTIVEGSCKSLKSKIKKKTIIL